MRFWLLLLLVPSLALGLSALAEEEEGAKGPKGHGDEAAHVGAEEDAGHAEEHDDHASHEPIDHVKDSSLDTILVSERKTTSPPLAPGSKIFNDDHVDFVKKGVVPGAVVHVTAAEHGLDVQGVGDVELPYDLEIATVDTTHDLTLAVALAADPGNITYTIKKKHFLSALGVTKHVLMLWIAGGLTCLMGFSVGRAAKDVVPTGLRNFVEAILLFLRDEVAKPQLGHDVDKYMPFIWTFFFFILFCNLLGLVPGAATATGNINVTAALAIAAFTFYHLAGIQKQGLIPYLRSIVPGGIPLWLYPLMLIVEIIGHLAKPFALAVRLFANMIAGHIVMAVILGFAALSVLVAPISVAGGVFMYFLETFVAFLQAFIFTFLMTVFLGMAVHPDH